jgi:NAD(P)-dependent dehydrogenase (short-subunit alcohol dehydrogenase family)
MSQDTRGNTRTVVITGGNSGLGYGCARAILGSNNGPWHVVIASRDADREQTASRPPSTHWSRSTLSRCSPVSSPQRHPVQAAVMMSRPAVCR